MIQVQEGLGPILVVNKDGSIQENTQIYTVQTTLFDQVNQEVKRQTTGKAAPSPNNTGAAIGISIALLALIILACIYKAKKKTEYEIQKEKQHMLYNPQLNPIPHEYVHNPMRKPIDTSYYLPKFTSYKKRQEEYYQINDEIVSSYSGNSAYWQVHNKGREEKEEKPKEIVICRNYPMLKELVEMDG